MIGTDGVCISHGGQQTKSSLPTLTLQALGQFSKYIETFLREMVPGDGVCLLKACSLMSNRGRSQNFQNLNFLHISVALP